MLIRKLDPESFVNAYNVDLQLLYPWEGVVEPPFGAAWAVLAPGESTKPHAHQECETFFVSRGRGEMTIAGERSTVEPGTVTFHRPFDGHVLTNTGDEPLVFLTVWWEDKERWTGAAASEAAAERPHRTMVTAAPPTPNGDLHLGHLAGPYLGADVHARYLRLRGVDARYACGTDDNSIYVETKGAELGISAEAAADRFATAITETLDAAGADLATFPRPNASPHHGRLTRELFLRLREAGAIEEATAPAPWCDRGESCPGYLFESAIRGGCPHCGAGVVGNTCEECGRVNDAIDLVDPACTACGRPPAEREATRWVFPLEPHREALGDFYRQVEMNDHLRALVERLLEDVLPTVAVTHPAGWGVEVPVEGYEDQRIYVWLEMAARYLAYAEHLEVDGGGALGDGETGDGWHRWWRDPRSEVVQFFGFDNSFYYGMLLPAVWRAFDPELRLPTALVTNEFYRLDGAKFSTSRDHRILGRDLLAEAPRDAVRYFLARTAPERSETNFTREELRRVLAEELVGTWDAWLRDLGERLAGEWQGAVPSTGDWTSEHRRFYHRLEELLAEIGHAWEAASFSPQRAVRGLGELVREARRFGAGQRHWRGVVSRGEERRTAFALELLAAKVLAVAASPVMPELGRRLWHELGAEGEPSWEGALDWLPSGERPPGTLGETLFPGLAEYLERAGSGAANDGSSTDATERVEAPAAV